MKKGINGRLGRLAEAGRFGGDVCYEQMLKNGKGSGRRFAFAGGEEKIKGWAVGSCGNEGFQDTSFFNL